MAIRGFDKKDPMAGLNQLMQLMNQMGHIQDRKKSEINTNLNSILEAAKYATNEDTMKNVINQYKSMAPDASVYQETNTQYNLIGGILQDRNSQINQYSKSVQDAENIINDAGFLDKESEFVDLHSNIMSIKNEYGSQKYESVMEWVSNEYARIESISNTLASGQKLGLKRGQGIDDSNITKDIDKYKNRLNVALEALIGDNTITPEEANLIIMGDRDTFKSTRNRKINEAEYGIKNYDALIEIIDKQEKGLSSGKGSDINFSQIFSQFGIEGDEAKQISEYINQEGIFGMNESELSSTKDMYIMERNRMIDSYKSWSGSDFIGAFKTADEIGADELRKAADNISEGMPPLNPDYKEKDIDKDKDGVPDTVDVDAGTGTDKTVITPEAEQSFYDKETIDGHNLSDVKQKKYSLVPSKNYSKAGKDEIKNVENRLREKKEILDGIDKASSAMNKYLMGELNQNQALSEGAFSGKKSRKEVIGGGNRKKLRNFYLKFKEFEKTGRNINDFIDQNQKEYFELTRILKYGKYWKKVNKSVVDKHYTNLYD